MNDLLDPEIQRKLALQSFFQGAGFKEFKANLTDLLNGAQDGIDSLCKSGFIDEKKFSQLNFSLGRKDALQKVLYVLEDMENELKERISPDPALKDNK